MIARRDLLAALALLGAGAVLPALASPLDAVDKTAGARIGQAWLSLHPDQTAASLTRRLAQRGWSPEALERLRLRVSADFRQGRVFRHRGWRLSDTEGALFALLALS